MSRTIIGYEGRTGYYEYYLEPRYDSRKSFYNKASVSTEIHSYCEIKKLYSYGTLVAEVTTSRIEEEKETYDIIIYRYFGKYSQTTTRHQKEFFKQENLTDDEIKTLFKLGELEKKIKYC